MSKSEGEKTIGIVIARWMIKSVKRESRKL